MRKEASLKKNFILNAILTLSGIIFPFISFPYVSDILGPDGTGKVDFAMSVVTYFSIFAQLGIPTYGIKACAQVREDKQTLSKTVAELMVINLFMTAMAFIVFIPTLLLIPKFSSEKNLLIIMSSLMVFNAIGVEYLYRGLEQYSYITKRSVAFKFIAMLSMFILIKSKSDYVIYGAITIFATSASNVLNFFNSRKYISFRKIGVLNIRKHLKPVGVYFAMSCATTIYLNLDKAMLGFLCTDTDVGYYGAAVKIKTILVALVTSLGAVILPRASYYVEQGRMDEFKRISKKALDFVVLASVPLTVFFSFSALDSIIALSGNKYMGSVVPMQVIMPTLILIGITNIFGIQIMTPLGKEKYVLYSEIAGAIADLLLNAILIPQYKATGAAIGTLIAEFVVLIVQYHFIKKEYGNEMLGEAIKLKTYWKKLSGAFISILPAVLAFIIPYESIINHDRLRSFIRLGFSAVLYFVTYAVFLAVTKDAIFIESYKTIFEKFGKSKK